MNSNNQPQERETLLVKDRKEKEQAAAQRFKAFAPSACIFAVIFTICAYNNKDGLGFTLIIAAWLILNHHIVLNKAPECMSRLHSPYGIFLEAALLILSVCIWTGTNEDLRFLEFLAMVFLECALLIHIFLFSEDTSFISDVKHFLSTLVTPLFYVGDTISDFSSALRDRRNRGSSVEKDKTKRRETRSIVIGIVIAVPLLVVVLLLLSSADPIFREITGSFFSGWDFSFDAGNIVQLIVKFLFAYFCVYSLWAALAVKRKKSTASAAPRKKANSLTAFIFLTPVTVVYLIFCLIQLRYVVFHGNLPAGLSYADYVHEGFYQLTSVAALNLFLVGICRGFFEDNRFLKAMLFVISGCTYIMILSGVIRMKLYIDAYNLTFLRLFVLWFMLVLTVLLTLLILRIANPRFPLFRASVAAITICFLAFVLIHPDYQIAWYNMAKGAPSSEEMSDIVHANDDYFPSKDGDEFDLRYQKACIKYGDVAYLISLSPDAVPALAGDSNLLYLYKYQLKYDTYRLKDEDWQKLSLPAKFLRFNYSRWKAIQLTEEI